MSLICVGVWCEINLFHNFSFKNTKDLLVIISVLCHDLKYRIKRFHIRITYHMYKTHGVSCTFKSTA